MLFSCSLVDKDPQSHIGQNIVLMQFLIRPHVLYTVPTGQNPSSATLTLERATAIYAVAQKHDIVSNYLSLAGGRVLTERRISSYTY